MYTLPYPLHPSRNKRKMAKVVSDNRTRYVQTDLNGDDLNWSACTNKLWSLLLKIRHGHGALVVVRGGESLSHGEGGQFTLHYNEGKVREAS